MNHILYKITYLPHLGTNYPKYYIGSKYNYRGNYIGSVHSIQVYEYTQGLSLRDWWKKENKEHPENFAFEILHSWDDISTLNLVEEEHKLHLELNVLGDEYFNHSIATKGYCAGKCSMETKQKKSIIGKMIWNSPRGEKLKNESSVRAKAHWDQNPNRKTKVSERMKDSWKNGKVTAEMARLNGHHGLIGEKSPVAVKLEYNGTTYFGWKNLQDKTGVTKHLYKKYYLNGLDPTSRIGANGPDPLKGKGVSLGK